MKYTKTFLLLQVIFFSCLSTLFAQIQFESGYFINNEGVKQACLIKNIDWRNNPSEISYKIREGEPSQLLGISEIQEFGLSSGTLKYIRTEVKIDRSKDSKMKASYQSEPEWSTETLFLKYEVEGELSLFSYWDTEVLRYFYRDKDASFIQLVNKPYFKKGITDLYWNHKFRQTLWAKLNCSEKPSESYVSITYDKRSLKKYFRQENACRGSVAKEYNVKKAREAINIKITPGIKMAKLDLQYLPWEPNSVYFDQKISARLGLELEYILPFNKNKWALFVEPTFQSYKSEHVSDSGTYSIDYKSIELPFGVRHYFFVHPKAKVFINIAATIDINLAETVVRFDGNPSEELEIFPGTNIDYGLGFVVADKISLEARYHSNRQTRYLNFWDAPYSGLSLILGYIFE